MCEQGFIGVVEDDQFWDVWAICLWFKWFGFDLILCSNEVWILDRILHIFSSTSHGDFQSRRAPMAVRGWTCATLSASGIGWWDLVGLCMAMTWCGVSFVSELWPGHSYFSASPGQCCFGEKKVVSLCVYII